MKTSLLLSLLLACRLAFPHDADQLCARYSIKNAKQLSLSDSEKHLICGDPTNPDWKNIPDNQAIFNLKAFLQQRGYYHPTLEKTGDMVTITLGERTLVKSLNVQGKPPDLDITRLRKIIGQVMTPALLDEVKQRIQQRLQSMGYACPKLKMEGNYDSGELQATLDTGPKMNLLRVIEERVEGVDENVFSRYHAFRIGEIYNQDYFAVTAHRVLDQSVVQSTYFTTVCEPKGATATQKFVAGPPRLLKFAAGVDTERLLILRTSWTNARIGKESSSIEIAASASFKDQQFSAQSSWYVLPYPSRFFLKPSLLLKHENISPYENLIGKVQFAPAYSVDTQDTGMSFFAGPTANFSRTFRGAGPSYARYLTFSFGSRFTDHYYELYRNSPKTGFDFLLNADVAQNNLLSDFSAQKLYLSFEKLWNWNSYDPSFLVIGLRGYLGTTLTDRALEAATLPTDFRYFLGGSPDLRGFGYRELPMNGAGALTSLSASFELRFTDLIPWGVQPFAFVDAGALGKQSFSITSPLFWSPGMGVRWESVIGVIRTTVAHGFISKDTGISANHSHWQFYFSFGEEF